MSVKVKINTGGVNAKNIEHGQLFKDATGVTYLRLNGGAISLEKDPKVFAYTSFSGRSYFANCTYVGGNTIIEAIV